MKVGVIGSKSSCEVVKKSIKEIDSSVEVAAYEEEQVNRSDRLIEECEQECDAVLFTGCAIESFVGRNYHFTRPHVSYLSYLLYSLSKISTSCKYICPLYFKKTYGKYFVKVLKTK